jgi:DNA-binding NtrC family response regulator
MYQNSRAHMEMKKAATILVIDDDESLRESLRRTLRRDGYTVMEAAEGGAGLLVLKNHPVDVVLVDLFMPGKEGLETIMELRRSHLKVGIIAMSGGGVRGQVDMLNTAKGIGRCQTLAKPFSREELLEAVEYALCPR